MGILIGYGPRRVGAKSMDLPIFEPGAPDGQGAAYNHIVTIESQFQKRRDSITQALWLYNGSHFWTYDDATSIEFKMDYVLSQKLAGVMAWNLGQDLADGSLLNAVVNGLKP